MKKLLSVLLAVVLLTSVAVLGGCSNGTGGNEDTTSNAAEDTTKAAENSETTEAAPAKDVPEVAGETQSWGKIGAVLVPEGLVLKKGAYGDETDENAVTVYEEQNELNHYYLINVMTSEEIDDSINATKEMNTEYGIEDVAEFTEGNNTFSGITYGEEGSFKIYVLKMASGDKSASVTVSVPEGTDITTDEVRAVLASIEIK